MAAAVVVHMIGSHIEKLYDFLLKTALTTPTACAIIIDTDQHTRNDAATTHNPLAPMILVIL